jgi:recombinational DNA repair protein (RecF pathway)
MAKICFGALAETPERRDAVTLYFELWVLKLGGFLPDWSKCGICDRALAADERSTVMFSHEVACVGCRGDKGAETLDSAARALFLQAQVTGPERFFALSNGLDTAVRSVSLILRRVLEQIAGRQLRPPDRMPIAWEE